MARPQSLIALMAVMLVTMTGFGVFLPIFPFLALSTGASAALVTWAMGAYSLGQFLAAPLWGRLSDRVGRKPILIVGLLGAAVSYLILAHAETALQMAGARLFGGLMAGNAGAAFAAAADLSDEKTRARNMGLLGAAVGFGFIAGPALGAWIVGPQADVAGFRRICEISALFALGAALLAFFFFRETRNGLAQPSAQRARSFTLVMTRPMLALFVGVTLVAIAAQAMLETTFGLWSHVQFAWGPQEVGWTLAGMGLAAALLQGGAAGRAAKMLGERRTLIVGLAIFALGFSLMANAHAVPMMIAGLAGITAGVGLCTPALQSLVAHQASDTERGAVMGLNQSSSALGRVLGPAVAGPLFDEFDHAAPYVLAAALLAAACALVLLRAPRPAPI